MTPDMYEVRKNTKNNSADIAKEFLDGEGYDPHGIKEVMANIMATQRGLAPKTEAQSILKDADTSHFAKRSYMDTAEALRKELRLLGLCDFSRKACSRKI